ncbi:transporter substrate-binding domain-containing protein [Massilibacteroides sp.]|uniref:transporter substrate-binding domain-containing protein n=1 Tax=Massilibacteroides sp. TaxID=2034766 RepID=UPI002617AC2D|nr:transporter substrate-binding domain-containing protein [Massilibacteroides sp.]MDD4514257.1 transporter substrate-binding domain-containing protein [Massilibacteroides sp.]
MKSKKLLIVYLVLLLIVILVMTSLWQFLNKSNALRDYPQIAQEGVIRIVTEYNQAGYYISGDTIEGFQYDLSQAISNVSGLEVQISLSNRLSDSFKQLTEGKYDIIAQNIPVTADRKEEFLFTDPIVFNKQVLVQRANRNDSVSVIRNQLDLAKKQVYIPEESPALLRIHNLEDEIGDSIYVVEDKTYSEEQLIIMVAKGEIDYAVCDQQIAETYHKLYPEIDIDTDISFTQLQSWVVRKDAPILLDSLNSWLDKIRKNGIYDNIYKRYYKRR